MLSDQGNPVDRRVFVLNDGNGLCGDNWGVWPAAGFSRNGRDGHKKCGSGEMIFFHDLFLFPNWVPNHFSASGKRISIAGLRAWDK